MKQMLKFVSAGLLLGLVVSLANAAETVNQGSIVPVDLRVEYLDSPQGLDVAKPRLSWKLKAVNPDDYGQKQTAYRIQVSKVARENSTPVWDSGWVKSAQTQLIEYQGNPLESDAKYSWTIFVRDENGKECQSTESFWTTGLFRQSEWTAKWIGSDELFDVNIGIKKGDCNVNDPWLRKMFELKETPQKANLFVASVGYHEVYINGEKIDDSVLSPTVTDHTKRARYLTYDIAKFLKPGKNVVAIWLGTSWAIFPGYQTENLPRTPIVCAQADIYKQLADEKPLLRLQTDETWKTHPSPNKLLGTWDFGNMGGEIWDANKEIPNWNVIDFDDSAWKNATVYHPNLKLSAQKVEKNKIFMNQKQQPIKPIAIEKRGDGVYRFDMGVNFAGWTNIKLNGEPNSRIDIQFSERQQNEMTFRNRSAYILNASGEGTFKNHFNYSSGRWITVRGLKKEPTLDDIIGWNVHTDFKRVGNFECSDALQNWIYDRVCWTFENLSLGGFVVDCPQRERMGYGGDAHATSETAMFNYSLGAFYTKWLEDWRDVQGTEPMVGDMNNPDWARKQMTSGRIFNNGIQPHTAPTYWGGGGPAWGGICVTLPYILYQHEGDQRVLEENFEMIKKWLAFLDTNVENDLLKRFGGQWDFLGDWLWPNATAEGMNNDSDQTICLNNCYRVFNLRTAAKIARIIGKTEEAETWEKQAETSSRAIHAKYYRADEHNYADGSMACLAGALLGNVMPPELRETVMKRLEKEILEVRKGHIHVGITAGAMLFKVLREAGRDDLIFSMTSQTDYPSWGFMRSNDATTIWEMWEKDLPGHSLLHSSYLYPGAWYIDGLGGIRRDTNFPGFQHFIVRLPKITKKQLEWSKASFDSPAGLIATEWHWQENGKCLVAITVPPNAHAKLFISREYFNEHVRDLTEHADSLTTNDTGAIVELSAGKHELICH